MALSLKITPNMPVNPTQGEAQRFLCGNSKIETTSGLFSHFSFTG